MSPALLSGLRQSPQPVLEMLEQAEMLFRRVYPYETVEGFTRVLKERIPISCFRELIANALIHREWLINSRIKVEMYLDRLYVLSQNVR